jgi:hypothetical protein
MGEILQEAIMVCRKILLGLLLAIIALLATGCTNSQVEPSASATLSSNQALPTYTITQTLNATMTETKTSTSTESPTITPALPTSTSTSIPTLTPVPPTPTITLTPEPTLTGAQSQAYLFELLRNNAGCKLPCWWGIVPGVTTWEETNRLIQHMGERTSGDPVDNRGTYYGNSGFNWDSPYTVNDVGFYVEKDIVEGIDISGIANEDVNFFRTLWKSYSPEQVIATYGPPTRVLVGIFWYGDAWFFSSRVILAYDESKFVAIYEGRAVEVNEAEKPMFRICPSWGDIAWTPKLNIFILSPNYPMTLDEYIRWISSFDISDAVPIEDAAGITPEEFSQRFVPGYGPACFDTPQEMWK